jgi:phosphoribosylformimino-5-aminoimidazole carboxamide ribotide isomerase
MPLIIAGGVATLDDIRRVKAEEGKGLEGVVIGKALYTDAVDLAKAMSIAHAS